MKIKIKSNPVGSHKIGDEVEAITNPKNLNQVVCFDSNGLPWYYFNNGVEEQWEIVEEEEKVKSSPNKLVTMHEFFGQDLKLIEFK